MSEVVARVELSNGLVSVLLPLPGERVVLPGPVSGFGESLVGTWVGAEVPDWSVSPSRVKVWTLGDGGGLAASVVDPGGLGHEEIVVVGEPAVDAACAVAALWGVLEAEGARQRAHERWVQQVTVEAHAEADERGWCGDFDEFMERVGLAARERDYTAAVTVRVSVSVRARSVDAAREAVTDELVIEELRERCASGYVYHDVDDVELDE